MDDLSLTPGLVHFLSGYGHYGVNIVSEEKRHVSTARGAFLNTCCIRVGWLIQKQRTYEEDWEMQILPGFLATQKGRRSWQSWHRQCPKEEKQKFEQRR